MDCFEEANFLFNKHLEEITNLRNEFKQCEKLTDYQYLLFKLLQHEIKYNKLYPHHAKRLKKSKTGLYNRLEKIIYKLSKNQ